MCECGVVCAIVTKILVLLRVILIETKIMCLFSKACSLDLFIFNKPFQEKY